MAESLTLTEHVIRQAIEDLRDHRQALADLATRLEPLTSELVEVWSRVDQDAIARRYPTARNGAQENAVEKFLSALHRGAFPEFFSMIAELARALALSGLSYAEFLRLVREFQRVGLPIFIRAFPPGPEIQLAFKALDDLSKAIATTMGAAYVEMMQEQLMRGARFRELGQLAAGAAHAINNLFATILGRTQLLIDRAHDTESRNELQEIRRAASVGAQMVQRLQDFAQTGHEEKFATVDLNLLLREAAEISRFVWRDQAEVNGVLIEVVKDLADVPLVSVKPNELRAVFVELILGAVGAMPSGGTITLRTERKGDQVIARVSNTSESVSNTDLTALANVIELENGTLAVEREHGRGTTIALAFPVASRAAEEQLVPAQVSTCVASVLIVEDEPALRDIIRKALAMRGYQVVIADSGVEGVAAAKRENFDLVITDLGMPGMSGWEVAREIKRLNSKTLVVLMTGWSVDLDAEKAKESGVDRVVHKPFDVDRVLELVGEAATLRERM